MTPLSEWQNFYEIVGSSAGALIGLQFLLMALIANGPRSGGEAQATEAFATPTIVHFAVVLSLAGVMSAPWRGMFPVELMWGLVGLFGVVYTGIVTWRQARQTAYKPEFEDWLYHSALPFVAFAALMAMAVVGSSRLRPALFGVAGVALFLLLLGIHNAWDVVTYYVFVRAKEAERPKETPAAGAD
jgi:hypothetical protein